ncbi:MAG: BACON domain-containing protein [Acidobacteriota bacterium]
MAPIISSSYRYWPQVTRYIRAGQARQSLLVWKIFGRRLDGRTNMDRPTERVAGDPSTIPAGADWPDCDLDYTGEAMPPPASGLALTWEERMKIARWVDLGAPIDLTSIIRSAGDQAVAGFLEDDLRPTLSLSPSAAQAVSISRFVIGAYDLDSGIDASTLSLTVDRAVGGAPAGTNLAAGQTISEDGTITINLAAPIDLSSPATVTAQIRDRAGHITRIVRVYGRTSATDPPNCAYSISPTSQKIKARGGEGSIAVTTSDGCAWQAATTASWITITQASGTGSGVASYSVARNSTGRSRKGQITIAGQTFNIKQKR